MNAHVPTQAPASIITATASVADNSANDVVGHAPAETRRVRVGITNSVTNAKRQLVVPFAKIPALLAELSPDEQLGPSYNDPDNRDWNCENDGILVFEAPAAPDWGNTPSKLWSCFRSVQVLCRAPCVGASFVDTDFDPCGRFHGARFVVAVEDDDDPALAAAIGNAIAECSVLTGARVRRAPGGSVGTYQGARLRVVAGIGSTSGELCGFAAHGVATHAAEGDWGFLHPTAYVAYEGRSVPYSRQDEVAKLLPPLTLDELVDFCDVVRCAELTPWLTRDEIFALYADVRSRKEEYRLASMSDYARVASMLGSAEPVFFAAARDVSGPAVMETLAALQRAAEQPDPLASFVRAKVVSVANMYRAHAADRSRFEILVAAHLRRDATYAALPPEDVARVSLAAWLFVAPASLFVGKGAATIGPLIVPGRGGESKKTRFFVEGLIPTVSVGAFVGEAGSMKSYTVADLAARVATSPANGTPRTFAGRTISGAPSVLYFGSEGVEGWSLRAERQILHVSGRPATEPHGLYIANGVPPLSSPVAALTCVRDKVDEIVKAGGEPPSLIVIDVLRAAVTGNEDNSGDMDLALSSAWVIARMNECAVLLVHHARKNSDAGSIVARGSSAFRANLDWEATIKRTGKSCLLTVTKNRNGIEGETFSWSIPTTDAPLHEVSGVTLTPDGRKIAERRAEAAGRVVWEHSTETRGITTTELNNVLAAGYPDLFIEDGKRVGWRLLRARTDAINAGYLAEDKGKRWIRGDKKPPSELSAPPEGSEFLPE
jgi:hypothetical protein